MGLRRYAELGSKVILHLLAGATEEVASILRSTVTGFTVTTELNGSPSARFLLSFRSARLVGSKAQEGDDDGSQDEHGLRETSHSFRLFDGAWRGSDCLAQVGLAVLAADSLSLYGFGAEGALLLRWFQLAISLSGVSHPTTPAIRHHADKEKPARGRAGRGNTMSRSNLTIVM